MIIVEFMDQILGPEDADMADVLKGRLEAEGVEIHTGTKAVRAESRGSAILLTVAPAEGDDVTTTIEGDAIFVADGPGTPISTV